MSARDPIAAIVQPADGRSGDGVIVVVHVQPRAGVSAVAGRHGDALRIRVAAPPSDGRATEAARRVLAEAFEVAPRQVTLIAGARSRLKRFHLAGVSPADASAVVARLVQPPSG